MSQEFDPFKSVHAAPDIVGVRRPAPVLDISDESLAAASALYEFFCLDVVYHYVTLRGKPVVSFDLVDQFLYEMQSMDIPVFRYLYHKPVVESFRVKSRSIVALQTVVGKEFREWLETTKFQVTGDDKVYTWRVKLAKTPILTAGRAPIASIYIVLPYSDEWHCTIVNMDKCAFVAKVAIPEATHNE